MMENNAYRIEIKPIQGEISAFQDDALIANSGQASLLRETRLNDYYYFPKSAVISNIFEPSNHRSFCPFKGTASYWHVKTKSGLVENGAWSYETPLPEVSQIAGLVSFTNTVANRYEISNPAQFGLKNDGHIKSPLSDWILREAAYHETRRDLVRALGNKLVDSGISIYRLRTIIWSLHPQIAGVAYLWSRDTNEVEVSKPGYEMFDAPAFINSPVNLVRQGLGGVRQPLNVDNSEFQFEIMDELKEEGATDYVAMPLRFSNGKNNCLTMASDHPDGFTTENLGLVFECITVLSRYFEVLTLKKNTTALLDTYLGPRTGQKVLSGDIRRGQGENIKAVILFSDLRNSTGLTETLERDQYLQVLNQYFETILDPVNENGGEVLKFIGDAVLAIFPIATDDEQPWVQVKAALNAAQSAIARISNPDQTDEKSIDLGIALHIGEVTYGNVGGQNRLDFTVIGPAVNLASRLESLCKKTDNKILMSKEFHQALQLCCDDEIKTSSIGTHCFDGLEKQHEVFTLVG